MRSNDKTRFMLNDTVFVEKGGEIIPNYRY